MFPYKVHRPLLSWVLRIKLISISAHYKRTKLQLMPNIINIQNRGDRKKKKEERKERKERKNKEKASRMTDMVQKKKEISQNSHNMARFKQTELLTGKWNSTGGNF